MVYYFLKVVALNRAKRQYFFEVSWPEAKRRHNDNDLEDMNYDYDLSVLAYFVSSMNRTNLATQSV